MTIRILPPRLANQIAAGEVVERPASVIKELVENSLDAGATHIEVLVEQGGHKRILVRDNGVGICKDELTLALSRHATSKVSHLDDIESIATLGFRGEALASISSVARLTLTSKTVEQSEAWLAYAEGRDMAVQLKPTAHPTGTSVEVVDLFFNTPARRKFLRAEKTEFHHIDELIKRLAMARFDVGFNLVHNGKSVRNLPLCSTETARLRRIASLCGSEFAKKAVHLSAESGALHIQGWLLPAQACGAVNPPQYTFINGRMIRDKVLTHAIRQAYAQWLNEASLAAYALYLTLPFSEVDVNVHPAKHEVRFNQSRMVHDFVVSAVQQALQPQTPLDQSMADMDWSTANIDFETGELLVDAGQNVNDSRVDIAPLAKTHIRADSDSEGDESLFRNAEQSSSSQAESQRRHLASGYQASRSKVPNVQEKRPNAQHWQSYHALMSPAATLPRANLAQLNFQYLPPHLGVVFHQQSIYLVDLKAAEEALADGLYSLPWQAQPLLLPFSILIEPEQMACWLDLVEPALKFGIELSHHGQQRLIIKSLPALLRHTDLASSLAALQQALSLSDLDACRQALLALGTSLKFQYRAEKIIQQALLHPEGQPWLQRLTATQLMPLLSSSSLKE